MSLWLTTKRIARYGLIGLIRNGFVSLSAILIMTITLFVLAGLLISSAALRSVLTDLTNKVDVTVYFVTTASPDDIARVQKSVQALPEVASATYVSREEALTQFKQRHQNDQLTMRALSELGDNPLEASLQIRAKDTSQYETIASYVSAQQGNGGSAANIIDKVNFSQNKTAIDRLTNIIETSRRLGIGVALMFGLASVLIAFNTIRLAIYTARDEISVMNLVGASRSYVSGPFMIAGVLYGVISGLIVLALLYPITLYLGPSSERFFGAFNVFGYYIASFPLFFLIVMGSGILLGALSSFLAVRRYLNA